jgi:hypothetical protein
MYIYIAQYKKFHAKMNMNLDIHLPALAHLCAKLLDNFCLLICVTACWLIV